MSAPSAGHRSSGASAAAAKRALDVCVSAAGLVLTWPLLLVIAAAVRLESKGPVIFRQERVGRHGQTFRIHKFRSLYANMPGAQLSPSHDSRITGVGALLRRTKLDELPQLYDVLLGSMSLVGPRPEVPMYVAHWPALERNLILSVRPGITDPASIALRNEADELAAVENPERYYLESLLPQKVSLYAAYVRHWTLLGDLRILAATARAVIRG